MAGAEQGSTPIESSEGDEGPVGEGASDVLAQALDEFTSSQKAGGSFNDRRDTLRKTVAWRARVLLPGGVMWDARAVDISGNGVGLVSPEPIAVGRQLRLALQVPQLTNPSQFQVVDGVAQVAFAVLSGREFRLGLFWVQLGDLHRTLLTAWVERIPSRRAIA